MVQSLDEVLSSYQKKIGSYDKQKWEMTVEERMSKGSNAVPKKVAKVKTELIDLDLIRGTAFTKTKPQQGWLSATHSGIIRVLLMPFYLKWWTEQTNGSIGALLLALYSLQIVSIYLYFSNGFNTSSSPASDDPFSDVPSSEVLLPIVMMTILGVIHSQIVGTKIVNKSQSSYHSSKFTTNSPNLHKKRRKRKSKQTSDKCSDHSVHRVVKNVCSDEESGLGSLDIKTDVLTDMKCTKRRAFSSIERLNFNKTIPRIEIHEKVSAENSDLSSDEFDVEDNTSKQYFWRRFSESKPNRRRKNRESLEDIDVITRRYSEGNKDSKNKKFRENAKLRKRKRLISLHLSPPLPPHHSPRECSSCDSEETMSPMSPNTPTPVIGIASDVDWPLINSEGSSDEVDSHPETTSTAAKYFIYPEFRDDMSAPLYNIFNEFCVEENTNETKVSCAIWQQHECQKVDLSVLDISSSIIRKVDSMKHSSEYIYLGFLFSIILAILPGLFRLQQNGNSNAALTNASEIIDLLNFPSLDLVFIGECIFGSNWRVRCVVFIAMVERGVLSMLYFFVLCVAERTFKQRFLYAKYFSQLTRRDRAKRSEVPHFRLHKVRNLKVWLSVRSYLRRHGPIRSVDAICSSSFVIAVCILTFICLQLLKESEMCADKLYCWELVFWNLALGLFIMRLMILGSRINRKYRENLSILITEQINLYLQLEQKPHKKEELTLANHVLKLAADLLKELESPYKISGFCANPYLYNITKVVVLSAFSAVLTELLGFKLKLYKIKLR